ncbi:MAG: hypothetical protein NDI69_05580 [Bacteriovoracaceae bacterium]|nr:hypothetical protein [Bacteriovoracaceae bacterium]
MARSSIVAGDELGMYNFFEISVEKYICSGMTAQNYKVSQVGLFRVILGHNEKRA